MNFRIAGIKDFRMFRMREKLNIHFFSAIIMALAISVTLPPILNLTETDALSPDLCLENPNQENLPVGETDESRAFGLSAISDTLLSAENLLKPAYHSFDQTFPLHQRPTILRC
jgi:hypothetical protein